MLTFWIETISTVAMILAIVGVWLNNHQRRACFKWWIVSNALTLAVHLAVGLWGMSLRDVVFLALAFHGWKKWGNQSAVSNEQLPENNAPKR